MTNYSRNALGQPPSSPSPSAADRADSSSRLLEGSAADPAARAPSKDTAVDIWLLAARCTGQRAGSRATTAAPPAAEPAQAVLRCKRACDRRYSPNTVYADLLHLSGASMQPPEPAQPPWVRGESGGWVCIPCQPPTGETWPPKLPFPSAPADCECDAAPEAAVSAAEGTGAGAPSISAVHCCACIGASIW